MIVREIGSEFWNAEYGDTKPFCKKTYLSGRTALMAIILDLKSRGIKNVCLPDYLCESMIEPFQRERMEIGFYPVQKSEDGLGFSLDIIENFDAVMLVNYFGFTTEMVRTLIFECKRLGKTIILDQTHAVFTDAFDNVADYIFGSYRKWTGIEAGFTAGIRQQTLLSWELSDDGAKYLSLRDQARKIKKTFVKSNYSDEALRRRQLVLFEKAENFLDRNYLSDTDRMNKSLLESLDVEYIKNRRRDNAETIYEQLQQIETCTPLFSGLSDRIIPLAVPILVPNERRDSLRTHFKEHGIFCPIHWPLSGLHKVGEEAKKIYSKEISLVCDQRYNTKDMIRMMEIIKRWEKITSK